MTNFAKRAALAAVAVSLFAGTASAEGISREDRERDRIERQAAIAEARAREQGIGRQPGRLTIWKQQQQQQPTPNALAYDRYGRPVGTGNGTPYSR